MMATIIGTGLEGYIKRNAREKALNRVAEAQKQAAEIEQQAKQRAALIRQESQDHIARTIRRNQRRNIAQAQLSAQQMRLRRREEMIDRVWAQARACAAQITAPDKRIAMIRDLTADAASQLGGGELEIKVNAQDRGLLDPTTLDQIGATLREQAVTAITLAKEPAAIMGGVIVRRVGSHDTVNNSLDERFRMAELDLRDLVYEMLSAGTMLQVFESPASPDLSFADGEAS